MTKKGKFLKDINEAFARSDTGFIINNMTDDILWHVIGDRLVEGKEALRTALKEMEHDEPLDLSIHNIITHGNSAAVNGEMKTSDGKVYSFCDVYQFSGFKNPKIKQMTSYVVEVQEE